MEQSKSTAYAFMIMLAGLALIGYLGRASAEVAPHSGYAPSQQQQAYGAPAAQPGYAPQYGLVQTGMMGVSQMGMGGEFGRPAVMPVFQVVQLQPAAVAAAAAQADYMATQRAEQPAAPQTTSTEAPLPPGMSVAPQLAGTYCAIKGIQALTPSPEACAMAGGQPVAP